MSLIFIKFTNTARILSKLNSFSVSRFPGLTVNQALYRNISSTAGNFLRSEEDREAAEAIIISRHPERDRRFYVDVDTSIRYVQSAAFKEAYGDQPVWFYYRRNFKGHVLPYKTRKTCIRGGVITNGSPCPICRDEYLVVDYRNIDLLKHFINPISGKIFSEQKTSVCQKQQKNLLVAYKKALDLGLITYDVPIRIFNYKEYESA